MVGRGPGAEGGSRNFRTFRPWMIGSDQRFCFPQQIGHPATPGHRLAMATRLPVASATPALGTQPTSAPAAAYVVAHQGVLGDGPAGRPRSWSCRGLSRMGRDAVREQLLGCGAARGGAGPAGAADTPQATAGRRRVTWIQFGKPCLQHSFVHAGVAFVYARDTPCESGLEALAFT
eukprot:COSAG01_NODE_1634_length_9665_cov_3.661196_6_plen_176_part_00